MGDLTENFNLSEFQSKDGSKMPQNVIDNINKLVINLQELRNYLGLPVSVTKNGGYRSAKHNRSVGGVKRSQHILGNASDIKVNGYTPQEIKNIIEDLIEAGVMEQGGLGLYETFVHYDRRGTKARWFG